LETACLTIGCSAKKPPILRFAPPWLSAAGFLLVTTTLLQHARGGEFIQKIASFEQSSFPGGGRRMPRLPADALSPQGRKKTPTGLAALVQRSVLAPGSFVSIFEDFVPDVSLDEIFEMKEAAN
jgi:hypothetical protein